MDRQSGILMPIFSLPSKYGAGSFGKESYKFVDFLCKAGQRVWQILPLVQTGYGNSPYSSVSAESFNPYFISIDILKEKKLLKNDEVSYAVTDGFYVNYGRLYSTRYPLLRKAFSRFDVKDKDFIKFLKKGKYRDYALYMAIKTITNYKPFYEWDEGLRYRNESALKAFEKENANEVAFWNFVQFEAEREWNALKKYANEKGVAIMGDMPLYVALDSVDVWVNPQLFKLDENFRPTKVAGVPPDYFSRTGQLWGNPVYDYEKHKEDNFAWWTERLKNALKKYDYVRIDHFRGLDRYYEVENGRPDATVGEWVDVPSEELFDSVHKQVDGDRIIAEDLGIIDDGVRELLAYTGYPGMKILSFAFNGEPDNLYLPENIEENSVCYTGTHDNDTLAGLIRSANDWDRGNFYRGVKHSLELAGIKIELTDDESLVRAITELGFSCKSKLFILPLFDAVGAGTEYRINEPGTVKEQNWAVRADASFTSAEVASKLKKLSVKYNRFAEPKKKKATADKKPGR